MATIPDTARRFAAVMHLSKAVQRTAERVVGQARTARRLGTTVEACHVAALELERQADRAETLLFGQAVQTLRGAAAESRLMADALDAMSS